MYEIPGGHYWSDKVTASLLTYSTLPISISSDTQIPTTSLSNSSNFAFSVFGTDPSVPSIIGMTITFMF